MDTLLVLALALIFEAVFGYPQFLIPRIGHPVIWIGRLIGGLDRRWNLRRYSSGHRRMLGLLCVLVLLLATILPALAAEAAFDLIPFGVIGIALLGSTLLAQRSLHEHVAAVATALEEGGVPAGRVAVSHIVGRDPSALDESGISRAAIESLAENFSDGVVAPAFWMGATGLAGAVAYKALNTADSMIGHRTPRHQSFGWAAARLDDLVNLPASRLAGLLIILAAFFVRGASPAAGWRTMWRDAPKHRSPNAGWPEAAMAGALGICIAGPRVYDGVYTPAAYMGDGRRNLTAEDIRAALRIYRVADGLLVLLAIGLAVLAFSLPD